MHVSAAENLLSSLQRPIKYTDHLVNVCEIDQSLIAALAIILKERIVDEAHVSEETTVVPYEADGRYSWGHGLEVSRIDYSALLVSRPHVRFFANIYLSIF